MKKPSTRLFIFSVFILLLMATSCGTGKGCDCPSFGTTGEEKSTNA